MSTQWIRKTPKKGKKHQLVNIPSSTVRYAGPFRLPRALEQENVVTVEKNQVFNLNSDVAGTIALVQGSSPAGIGDWSSLAGSFEEFRTLAFEIEFRPANRYSKVTTTTLPMVAIVDRAGPAALANQVTGANHASAQLVSLEDPFKVGCKMTGTDESDFIATATPVSVSWIKFYVTGNSVSTTYGTCFVKYIIQLRGEA